MNELESLKTFMNSNQSKERINELESMATVAGYWWLNKVHIEEFLVDFGEIDYDELMSKIANGIKKELLTKLIKDQGRAIIKSFADSTSEELVNGTTNVGLRCGFENGILMVIDDDKIDVNDNGKEDTIYVKKSLKAPKHQQK